MPAAEFLVEVLFLLASGCDGDVGLVVGEQFARDLFCDLAEVTGFVGILALEGRSCASVRGIRYPEVFFGGHVSVQPVDVDLVYLSRS